MASKPIFYTNRFRRSFKKRIAKNKLLLSRFKCSIELFVRAPKAPSLKDHLLKGTLSGYRAFSVAENTRVVYIETEKEFKFVDIGTHDQVYKQL